jgi:hypothetical protein
MQVAAVAVLKATPQLLVVLAVPVAVATDQEAQVAV